MEPLWAPWRMEYIERAGSGDGCFLCEAARPGDDRQKLVLWRGETCLCLMNNWPYNNGHLMVAPAEHKARLEELSEAELIEQAQFLRRCCRNLTELMRPDGFNVGLNLGQAAGAGLPGHMHWHVVPRWNADTNFMPVIADTKVIPQALDELWQRLREVDDG
jgi:ATP adenylyltransferase